MSTETWNVNISKTTLASVVINHLLKKSKRTEKEDQPTLYLYIDESDPSTQTLPNLLGSLLKQLVVFGLPEGGETRLRDVYHETRSHGRANQAFILEMLQQVIITYGNVYIVIDALSQLPLSLRDKLHSILQDIQSHASDKLSILITTGDFVRRVGTIGCNNCRKPDLLVYYRCETCADPEFDLCPACKDEGIHSSHRLLECAVDIEVQTKDEDIERYINWEIDKALSIKDSTHEDLRVYPDRARVTEFGRLCSGDTELRVSIVKTVIQRADGNILVAKLYMDELRQALSKGEINDILHNFPESLDTKYEIAMKRVEREDHRGNSMRVLAFLATAHRPLLLKELQHALGTHMGDKEFNTANYYRGTRLPSMNTGLIEVGDGDDNAVVQFSHPSLTYYLKRTHDRWFKSAEHDLASACLTYLDFENFSMPCKDIDEFRSREASYPFIAYASQYWGDHVRNSILTPALESMVMRLLDQPRRLVAAVQAAAWSSNPWGSDTWDVWQGVSELHVIAWYGLSSAFDALMVRNPNLKVNARDEISKRTPLMFASKQGHVKVIRQFLRCGAAINDVSERGETALFETIYGNHEEALKTLLSQTELEVNAVHTKQECRTGLMLAASQGQSNMVEILLGHPRIDVNAQDGNGDSALCLAAEFGSKETIQILLKMPNIEIDRVNHRGWSALYSAAKEDHVHCVEILLESKADSSLKDKDFQATAILRAADFGWYDVVDLMANYQSVDITCTDIHNRGLFHYASANGHTEVIQLLATCEELDPDAKDEIGNTALHEASRVGSLDAVQALLEDGATREIKNDGGKTPFQVACDNGNLDVASLLAGKSITDLESSLPVWALVKSGHSELVAQAIATRKHEVFETDPENDYTAVHWAVLQDEVEILRMLLEKTELSPDSTDKVDRTPLHLAAINNRLEAIDILLDHKADINPRDKWNALPIQLAFEDENLSAAVALIEKDAKIENIDIQQVFFTAVEQDKVKTTERLLAQGADVLAQDTDGRTAIEIAKEADNEELMKILYTQENFKNPTKSEKPTTLQARRVRRKRPRPVSGTVTEEANKRLEKS